MNEENNPVVFRRNAAFRFVMLATILLLSVTGCGKGLNADAGKKDSVSTDTGAGMAKTAEKVMEPEPAGDSQAADLTYVSPEYILSDPSRIRIFKFKDDASETQINGIMSVDEYGGISYAME